jgi:hypothetical protein
MIASMQRASLQSAQAKPFRPLAAAPRVSVSKRQLKVSAAAQVDKPGVAKVRL